MNESEILQKAIDTYGIDAQLEMVVEECSELIHAIQKLKRQKYSIYAGKRPVDRTVNDTLAYDAVCSEIADVQILIDQMMTVFDKETINVCRERKIKRLEERLNKNIF